MTTLLKNAWIYTPQGVIEGGYVVIDEAAIVSVGAERRRAASTAKRTCPASCCCRDW